MKFKKMIAGVYEANCYIVYDEQSRHGFVIDPGGNADGIISYIHQQRIKPQFIALTHGHGDHIGGVLSLKKAFGIPIYAHREEKIIVENAAYNYSGMMGQQIKFQADYLVEDSELIHLADMAIKVIHTPGHSPGSVCFLVNANLFSGDTLFKESIGRTDLFMGDQKQIFRSIYEKLLTLDDGTFVWPGHGEGTTIGHERQWNPFLIA